MVLIAVLFALAAVVAAFVTGFVLGQRRSVDPIGALHHALDVLDERAEASSRAALDGLLAATQAQLAEQRQVNQQLLAAQAEHHARIGAERLDARKDVIDTRLAQVSAELRGELGKVNDMLAGLANASSENFGRVSAQLASHATSTKDLAASTAQLREVLSSSRARGQWGERMAEDVLHLAGLVEHVNYVKQTALTDRSGIPDFTFILPKGHKLFMDVKFPLAAYLRYLEAETDLERTARRKEFLGDVRARVRELNRREYAQREPTALDDVLLFIPNETISAFIHEHEPTLFDDAMRSHIVLCSPLTLFAMLGVIRQAYDNFMVEQQATEILGHMGTFRAQWMKYTAQLDKVWRGFESTRKAFDELNGTRRNMLERPLTKIDQIRLEQHVNVADPELDSIGFLPLDALGDGSAA